ncbi:hypothetical protein E4T50_08879 [Aureobasidium sp. EXF-12298]|nr:hypothetical protein E4T50_08879 [Aureobasidium sp. EXF-12298]
MYANAILSTVLLAGQALTTVALPATTVTLHSVIIRTTTVPATVDAAGSNPSNAATPALFLPGPSSTTLATLSSFSVASPSRATQLTTTVTATEIRPFPVFVTVTDYYCPTPIPTSEVVPDSSAALPKINFVTTSSTATQAPSSTLPFSEPISASPASPAGTPAKTCVFPIPGQCDI